jgi:class 3 adenylate cyclase
MRRDDSRCEARPPCRPAHGLRASLASQSTLLPFGVGYLARGQRMATPGQDRVERRLAAVLATDVAGYSRLTGGELGKPTLQYRDRLS